jgi:heme-degrading monooxygenase HmoA
LILDALTAAQRSAVTRKGDLMVVVVFRGRVRPGVDQQALGQLGQRMYSIAAAMPGYISYKDFAAEDGETVSIVEFDTQDSLAAWREHPEHKAAQQRGRDEFFSEYHIQVCAPVRESRFRFAE